MTGEPPRDARPAEPSTVRRAGAEDVASSPASGSKPWMSYAGVGCSVLLLICACIDGSAGVYLFVTERDGDAVDATPAVAEVIPTPTPTPEPSPTAEPTSEPTPTPAPEPTPTATPEPTPEPTVERRPALAVPRSENPRRRAVSDIEPAPPPGALSAEEEAYLVEFVAIADWLEESTDQFWDIMADEEEIDDETWFFMAYVVLDEWEWILEDLLELDPPMRFDLSYVFLLLALLELNEAAWEIELAFDTGDMDLFAEALARIDESSVLIEDSFSAFLDELDQ